MGLRDRVSAAWDALVSRAPGPASSIGPTGGPTTMDAFRLRRAPTPSQLVESYRQAVYACVEINAAVVSAVPLRLYAVTGRGQSKPRSYCTPRPVDRATRAHLAGLPYAARSMAAAESVDEITSHPLLDVLDTPNPEFDRPSMLHFLSACLDVVGTAYVLPEGIPGLPPAELWPLPPLEVTADRSGLSAVPSCYWYNGREIKPDALIRIRMAGLRDPYGDGYPPAQAAFSYGQLEDVWITTRDQALRRGPKPAAIVGPADPKFPMGPEEAKRLQVELNRQHAGPAGGGLVVSSTGYTYHPISHKPVDYGDQIGPEALQSIANVFGVPLSFLTAATNLANLAAAERQHGRRAVGPRCVRIAATLTRWARRFDPRLVFAFDDACPDDLAKQSEIHARYIEKNVLTVNDVRGETGWEPVAWGDEPWLANTLRQPSEERPAPPPMLPPGAKPPGPEADDDEPEPEGKPKPKPKADDESQEAEATAAKSLMADAAALLRTLQDRVENDGDDDSTCEHGPGAGPVDDDDGRGAGDPPGEPEEAAQGGGEHLRSALGDADREDPETVVGDPGEGDPRDGADDAGGPAADGVPAADGL